MKIAALVLLALGVLGLIYGGIRYTTHDTVVDVGPIHVAADREHQLPIAPIAGALLIVGGATMLIVSRQKSA